MPIESSYIDQFFVRNKTRRDITLGDLVNLNVPAGKMIDLLKVPRVTKEKINQSQHLQIAVKRGWLEIVKPDVCPNPESEKQAIIADMNTACTGHGGGGSDKIGIPDDGTYLDGFFLTWTENTKISNAFDDTNEILKYLVPAMPLSLNNEALTISAASTVKYTGYLSVGATAYKVGDPAGSQVPYIIRDADFNLLSPNQATTFNWADYGVIAYYLNGLLNDSVDIGAAFVEADRVGSQTYTPLSGANGNVSITSVGWYNNFPPWQKGNATIIVVAADLVDGYNSFALSHTGIVPIQTTSTFDVFYDTDSSTLTLTVPTMIDGPNSFYKWLSGIKFFTINSQFQLSTVGSNLFKNVYVLDPILTSTTGGTIDISSIAPTDGSVTGVSNPPVRSETMTVTNKILTMNTASQRNMNLRFVIIPKDPYNSYPAETQTSASVNRLYDSYGITSTGVYEYFDDENRRLPYAADDWDTAIPLAANLTGQWDSTTSLSNGLAQVYNGSLYYPTINFTGYLPAGNPNYSTFSGNQIYYRAIYSTTNPHNNGILEFGGLVNADIGPLGSGNVNVEIKLPTKTGWLDLGTPYSSGDFTGIDGDGCKVAQSTNSWTWTSGEFTTGDSGFMYIVRVTLRNSTRSITQIREIGTGW